MIANFIDEDVSLFEVTLIAHPASYGSVTGMGDYAENTIAIATASTDNCHTFLHWTDEAGNVISADNPFEIIVISDTTLYANFEQMQLTLEFLPNGAGTITDTLIVVCIDDLEGGIMIEAFAEAGYVFSHWSNIDGDFISADNPYQFYAVSDTALIANFEEYQNIAGSIVSGIVSISPNPTVSDFTLSFDLEKSCSMQILLCDILGQKVLQIYDGFATAGNFTRTVRTNHLAKGIYFLKILIDGNVTVEKVVVE